MSFKVGVGNIKNGKLLKTEKISTKQLSLSYSIYVLNTTKKLKAFVKDLMMLSLSSKMSIAIKP
jgi:hypothetical protein